MSDEKIIITVSGSDKVGIVASVSTILAQYKVNIEDIKQTKSVEEIDTTTQDNINIYKTIDLQNCILDGYDTLATDEEYLEAESTLQHKYKLIMGGN